MYCIVFVHFFLVNFLFEFSHLFLFFFSVRIFLFCSPLSSKIAISGIPLHAHFDDIEPLLKAYGRVEHCDAVSSKDPNTQTVHITYETPEQALRYIQSLSHQHPHTNTQSEKKTIFGSVIDTTYDLSVAPQRYGRIFSTFRP